MKTKKFKFKQILKLHLLNSRAYEYTLKSPRFDSCRNLHLIEVICNFKKVLHIIYQFHSARKQILFIGAPKKLELKINELTPHLAIPKNYNLLSLIDTNKRQFNNQSKTVSFSDDYTFKQIFKLGKRPDLLVVISSDKIQSTINESYMMKIPLIIFEAENVSTELLIKSSYRVCSSNSNSTLDQSLLFLGLHFLFKKF